MNKEQNLNDSEEIYVYDEDREFDELLHKLLLREPFISLSAKNKSFTARSRDMLIFFGSKKNAVVFYKKHGLK